MCPRFFCIPQGAYRLRCSLDHRRVPRTSGVYHGLLYVLWSLWGVSWRSIPLNYSSNRVWIWCCILRGDSFVSTLHRRKCNILIIRETVLICKVIWSWVASFKACVHTLFAWYFLLNPHDLIKLRVIKEYFMEKVMLGFIGSNSNMAFAITDIVIWLFKFAVKYIMYFTEF